MNRDTVTGLVIGLLGGVILSYYVGANHPVGQPAAAAVSPAPAAAPGPAPLQPFGPMAAPASADVQQRILNTQLALAEDPKNVQSWISLGNDYFDTHQAEKAVDAYAKALALQPANPDVLTDQGIMYRELKAYDKAVANFEKAGKVQPKHLPSLFNLGIVYADDLKQPDKAMKAFQRVIELDPASAQAAKARSAIEDLKAHRAVH